MNDTALKKLLVDFRRDLHQIPELDFDLPRTRAYLFSRLECLNCEIKDLGKAGFTAHFASAKQGVNDTIAFRSDMDAIPVIEQLNVKHKSLNDGRMHACGHDGHMSILLGLAIWLNDNLGTIDHNCLLVFQAAEETTGGAKMICDTGVFEKYNVSRIFGLHIWPGYEKNAVVCRKNAFMAGTFVLYVNIEGLATHIADYEKGVDALEAGCKFIDMTYALEKALPADVFRLLRFGKFESGQADNIVADKAYIAGVMRAFDQDTFDYLWQGMRKIADEIEHETNAKIDVSRSDGYPQLINPEELYDETKSIAIDAGFYWIELEKPMLQAEDFSFYQHELLGLYMHLATGMNCKLHACDYDIDEDVLLTGVQLFRTLLVK